MRLDFSWNGNRKECFTKATEFLDGEVFKYPDYQVLIAGMRGAIVGQLRNVQDSAQGSIVGHVEADGSMIDTGLNIMFTGIVE